MNQKNNFTVEELDNKISIFSESDDTRAAFDYYEKLKKFIKETSLKQANPLLYGKYHTRLIKLKFLSLNIMDNWGEIEDLIKNHFEVIYKINYYDLWNKIRVNLLTEPVLANRDKIKEEIRKILLACDRQIVDTKKYQNIIKLPKTVAEWLKDYIIHLGNKEVDNLKRIEYLTNGENIKKLNKEDKEKVKILFDFYENLKYSSDSRKGFEESIPMTVNGKFIIFQNGEAEEISDNVIDLIKKIKTINSSGNNNLNELKTLAAQYPAGSFERKAIEEEIKKMNHE